MQATSKRVEQLHGLVPLPLVAAGKPLLQYLRQSVTLNSPALGVSPQSLSSEAGTMGKRRKILLFSDFYSSREPIFAAITLTLPPVSIAGVG
jgi:hypothetical protein